MIGTAVFTATLYNVIESENRMHMYYFMKKAPLERECST